MWPLKPAIAAVFLGSTLLLPLGPATPPDPAADLLRVTLIVKTGAPAVEIRIRGAAIATSRCEAPPTQPPVSLTVSGNTLRLVNGNGGHPVEADFALVLAGVSRKGTVSWDVLLPRGGHATLEVFNVNQPGSRLLADRFEAAGGQHRFATPVDRLRTGGPVSLRAGPSRLVLAAYYPWYVHDTWKTDKRLLDRPLSRYSTEQPDEVRAVFEQAKTAGIDAMAVSLQVRDHRMTIALQAAQAAGIRVAALIETNAAVAVHQPGAPVDPHVMLDWLTITVDEYASKLAYLRVNDVPVIFVYAAARLDPPTWKTIIGRLRTSGRKALLIGETTEAPWLDAFDGAFLYASAGLSPSDVGPFDARFSLLVRTFDLAWPDRPRRLVSVATVCPGYDATIRPGRAAPRAVRRADGAFYDRQWTAALAARPDWVFITSWNEWYENTEIEPGLLYGDAYLRATRRWTSVFGCSGGQGPKTDEAPPGSLGRRCG